MLIKSTKATSFESRDLYSQKNIIFFSLSSEKKKKLPNIFLNIQIMFLGYFHYPQPNQQLKTHHQHPPNPTPTTQPQLNSTSTKPGDVLTTNPYPSNPTNPKALGGPQRLEEFPTTLWHLQKLIQPFSLRPERGLVGCGAPLGGRKEKVTDFFFFFVVVVVVVFFLGKCLFVVCCFFLDLFLVKKH